MEKVAKGLAGVVVEDTAVSEVRSEGLLSYRGHPIDSLVDYPFWQVANLVLNGEVNDELARVLQPAVHLDARETDLILSLPETTHPMQVLQGVVPLLSRGKPLGYGDADQGLHVAAKLPAVIATHLLREAVQMDDCLEYAPMFLKAIGQDLSPAHVRAFNTTQILQMEHGFNAGTFAMRVVASTLAPVESAIAAGFGALYGPLHGGADEAALDLADSLADTSAAQNYINHTLQTGGKVPGMGHREYRVVDPRARYLERYAQTLTAGTEQEATYLILRELDLCFTVAMQARGKALHANVEFYKGLVLRILGLPNRFFTSMFAMARVYGYLAHFIESRQNNRIYRPAARYVGPSVDTKTPA